MQARTRGASPSVVPCPRRIGAPQQRLVDGRPTCPTTLTLDLAREREPVHQLLLGSAILFPGSRSRAQSRDRSYDVCPAAPRPWLSETAFQIGRCHTAKDVLCTLTASGSAARQYWSHVGARCKAGSPYQPTQTVTAATASWTARTVERRAQAVPNPGLYQQPPAFQPIRVDPTEPRPPCMSAHNSVRSAEGVHTVVGC